MSEFEVGTFEAQREFDKKRNYVYGLGATMETVQQKETKAILAMAEAIKALTQQLDDATRNLQIANERTAQLEAQLFGGSTK